ncbi:ABC transporter ATP-binding protein [Parasphingorhabdus sp.]|uniref:ABC transporter ATP-binding protein n=1 Tax=Parasphingorhabdus sp. TaxID=2709688 RepID=UPI003A95B05C
MTDVMIKAEGLGKSYLIGHQTERESYQALRDVIARTAAGFARSALDILRGRQILMGDTIEEFWALRDVDFEIRRGEVVGFIGRNGAGKSTLLKVLSRITEPSEGQVAIRGRVASLLEVGSGFHPELTGRENIYLNGAILGMSRAEIRRKFDEIVAFAEVEQFLDTPVKRYSSGMYVRLAFAVAAHLEPEILIVDEVLAVGDAAFQKKCLGKMGEVAGEGRTVLFVSHTMSAIEQLCSRCVVLHDGRAVFDGETSAAISLYLANGQGSVHELSDTERRPGTGKARITMAECDPVLEFGKPLRIVMRTKVSVPLNEPDFRVSIYNQNGICVSNFGSSYMKSPLPNLDRDAVITLEIPSNALNAGLYTLNMSISENQLGEPSIVDRIESAVSFQMTSVDPFGTGKAPHIGSIIMPQRWYFDKQLVSSFDFETGETSSIASVAIKD